jgi:hypothetical protein
MSDCWEDADIELPSELRSRVVIELLHRADPPMKVVVGRGRVDGSTPLIVLDSGRYVRLEVKEPSTSPAGK